MIEATRTMQNINRAYEKLMSTETTRHEVGHEVTTTYDDSIMEFTGDHSGINIYISCSSGRIYLYRDNSFKLVCERHGSCRVLSVNANTGASLITTPEGFFIMTQYNMTPIRISTSGDWHIRYGTNVLSLDNLNVFIAHPYHSSYIYLINMLHPDNVGIIKFNSLVRDIHYNKYDNNFLVAADKLYILRINCDKAIQAETRDRW